eukprot:13471707-Alexandrium_andersonii.AAC.1
MTGVASRDLFGRSRCLSEASVSASTSRATASVSYPIRVVPSSFLRRPQLGGKQRTHWPEANSSAVMSDD